MEWVILGMLGVGALATAWLLGGRKLPPPGPLW
jgi:hypothetical protein